MVPLGDAEQAHLYSRVRYAEPVLFLGEFLCAAACAQNHSNLTFLSIDIAAGLRPASLMAFG